MDQKSNERPQPSTARVQIDSPTPISLNGLTLQHRTESGINNLKDNEVWINNSIKLMPLHSEV